jgi:hypothetical protein
MARWIANQNVHRLLLGSLALEVHHHIDHDPDVWLLTSYDLGLRSIELKARDLKLAKLEAIRVAHLRASKMFADLVRILQ